MTTVFVMFGGTGISVEAAETETNQDVVEETTEEEVELAESTNEKIKLETPTGIRWDGWNMVWNSIGGAHGYYNYEMKKDGEVLETRNVIFTGSDDSGELSTSFSRLLRESGVYSFRVRAINSYDPESSEDSEWSEWSEVRTYILPEQAVGTTVAWWDLEIPGTAHWNAIEHAVSYWVGLIYFDESRRKRIGASSVVYFETTYDFSVSAQ